MAQGMHSGSSTPPIASRRSPPSRSDSDPSIAQAQSSVGRAPGHRSRNGCYTCRRRKVKCDERTPVCIKCEYSDRKAGIDVWSIDVDEDSANGRQMTPSSDARTGRAR